MQKYLETVSSVLEDAKKNDIIPFNPAHRVRKKHFEKEVQHIPQKYEMSKLMRAIQNEPILYRAYYTWQSRPDCGVVNCAPCNGGT